MNVAKRNGCIAIAKPVFILTLFKMIEDGCISENKILFTKKLKEAYKEIFLQYRGAPITLTIYPYYYLDSEDFYHLEGNIHIKTPSEKYIRDHIEFASLDIELWDMLQNAEIRDEFRDTIINHFLKKRIKNERYAIQ
jgi:putative restriction endonuclease